MGYHVIILKDGNQMKHQYVEKEEDLAYISDITAESIIYQGEPKWTPVFAGECEKYQQYTDPCLRAGIKAQHVFVKQAEKHKLVLLEISQDQASFKSFTNVAKSSIKRGDFLIMNAGHIEVDVKCKTFKREKGERYFHFNVCDIDKHTNMMNEITNAPVIIAVYERVGDTVNEDQLFMFEIGEMKKFTHTFRVVDHSEYGKSYLIPIGKTMKGFKLINQYRNKQPV